MFESKINIPKDQPIVGVKIANNRGFTPEEVAETCVDKIMSVSDTAPPAIRDQAMAYKNNMQAVIAYYMKEAIRSDRTTVYNAIKEAGHPELAELIRRL